MGILITSDLPFLCDSVPPWLHLLFSATCKQSAEKLISNHKVTKTRRSLYQETKQTSPFAILVPWCLCGESPFFRSLLSR
jgi:hypothetical protein